MINCNNLTGFFVWSQELAAIILAAVTAGLVAVTLFKCWNAQMLNHRLSTSNGDRILWFVAMPYVNPTDRWIEPGTWTLLPNQSMAWFCPSVPFAASVTGLLLCIVILLRPARRRRPPVSCTLRRRSHEKGTQVPKLAAMRWKIVGMVTRVRWKTLSSGMAQLPLRHNCSMSWEIVAMANEIVNFILSPKFLKL